VPSASAVLAVLRDNHLPVVCLCEPCCAHTVRIAANLIDEIALEQAEVVRARIAGIADRLRDSGAVLRSVDIPRSERVELLGCVQANWGATRRTALSAKPRAPAGVRRAAGTRREGGRR
jgi:hypothetical protein